MRYLKQLVSSGLVLTVSLAEVAALGASPQSEHQMAIYFGTYTGGRSMGIYQAHFEPTTGKLSAPELVAESKNPTFLALHPNGRILYAANEIGNFGGQKAGAVSAFSIEERTGKLNLLNQQPSGGAGPCHLSVDKSGSCVLVANYGSGSVALLPLRAGGQLSEPSVSLQNHGLSVNKQRQTGPHAHFIMPDPNNRFVLACDLGLDKVLVYQFTAPSLDEAASSGAPVVKSSRSGMLSPNDPPSMVVKPGSGPRHLAFHPNGRFIYLLNELGSTLIAFSYDATLGTSKALQTISTLPEDFTGENISAEVGVHPSGKFVYASNRGHDSIAVFAVDQESGKLGFRSRTPSGGKTPRHFAIEPSGRWLVAENQDSNNVVVFAVDQERGTLSPTESVVEIGSPVCAVFAATN
jgi:6-phosphogluconolactonase